MSRLNQKLNDTLPDYVYFDVQETNFKSTTTNPPIFTINETRNSPFIELPEKYDLSILRFQIDTGTLPLFIPSIQPDQADVNKTIYSVTIEDTDYPESPQEVYLNWTAQDKSATIPQAPSLNTSKAQDNTTGYYNCYSYNWLCDLVYEALQGSLNNLATTIGPSNMIVTGDTTTGGANAVYSPLLYWNATSKSAILQAQLGAYSETLIDTNGVGRRLNVYFNAPLFNLFNSFQSIYLGYEGVTFGRNNRIIFADVGGINVQQVIPNITNNVSADSEYAYSAITLLQEYSTQEQISPIAGLVFTSNTLPIAANQTSNVIQFINGIPNIRGTNASTENIITDMVSSTGLYRSGITYTPSAEYRRVHLYGNRPLSNLDINIYYRLKNGELVPFRMNSGGSVSLKIAFLKKV
jgi:hypothetical protein